MTLESLLGVALTQRNAGVDFHLCDGVLARDKNEGGNS
jgi:hypothetical protein